MVYQQGLEFFPVKGDAQALTNEMILSGMKANGLNLLSMYRGIMRTFGAMTSVYQEVFSANELRDTDAILSQLPGGFYGYDLAEALGVPYIALSVIPQEPTKAFPLPLLPIQFSLGGWYNKSTYWLGQQLAWHPFRKSINEFRRKLGLPPASFWWGNIHRMAHEGIPVLQGFSKYVVPKQSDWGVHVHTTGYWNLDEAGWRPSSTLERFLAEGDAPVFIGFGSMPVLDSQMTTDLILEALRHSNKRSILHAGWAKLGTADFPDTVFLLDYAPYGWLFPQMAAVIHHGGSGTTGFALRSGIPSMVVPFTADQPFWGKRTYELGLGPTPIPFAKLTANNLANAITVLTESPQMKHQSIHLRDMMASENGIKRAVEIIHQYLERQHSLS